MQNSRLSYYFKFKNNITNINISNNKDKHIRFQNMREFYGISQ